MPHSTSVFAESARVAADGGFDGERVLQQAFAFRVLVQQSPGVFAAEGRNHVVSLLPVSFAAPSRPWRRARCPLSMTPIVASATS